MVSLGPQEDLSLIISPDTFTLECALLSKKNGVAVEMSIGSLAAEFFWVLRSQPARLFIFHYCSMPPSASKLMDLLIYCVDTSTPRNFEPQNPSRRLLAKNWVVKKSLALSKDCVWCLNNDRAILLLRMSVSTLKRASDIWIGTWSLYLWASFQINSHCAG